MSIVFHNGFNYYYYHLMIKELEKEFDCLRENTLKYWTFTVPVEKKVTRVDKNGEEITENISYRLQSIGSARFMAISSSDLVNNLSEGIHKIKCKYGHNDKKCETCGIIYKYCECFIENINFKDD